MSMSPVILASSSPRRSQLLTDMGVAFQIFPSDAEESTDSNLTLHEVCQLNAYRKAHSVAKKYPDSVVIGADTLVCLDSERFGKPRDLAEAHRMIRALSGKTHEVVTGVCLILQREHRQKVFAVCSAVTFKQLSDFDIDKYLASIQPLDKAGGYAIQDHGQMIVEEVYGSLSNIIGLPVERLELELEAF